MYLITGYKTHEDEQYGHCEKLGTSRGAREGLVFARKYARVNRYYQINVKEDRKSGIPRLVYAVRQGDEYSFIEQGSDDYNKIKSYTSKLIDAMYDDGFISKKDSRFVLFEEKGKVYIKAVFGGLVVDDVLGKNGNTRTAEMVEKIIRLFSSMLLKGVKSYTFTKAFDLRYCYYTDSKYEYGSYDLYLDYF